MILIGTSGFSYKDWVGPYYPEKLPKKDWLAFYAREFKTCELNFTYYRLPDTRTLERMAAKVPAATAVLVAADAFCAPSCRPAAAAARRSLIFGRSSSAGMASSESAVEASSRVASSPAVTSTDCRD